MTKLRIGMLAPLRRSLNPTTTVSRNRIIVDLATGLFKKGHKVTVFASSDSYIPGIEIVGISKKGLNFLPPSENPFYTETAYISHEIMEAVIHQDQFDIIHNHMYPEFLPLLAAHSYTIPVVTTIHAQVTQELVMALSDTYKKTHLVCISKSAQKRLNLPSVVIYNGIDITLFSKATSIKRSYFLFVGRMSKVKDKSGKFLDPKGVRDAIMAAERLGEELRIVGNVEDRAFYDTIIAPHLSLKIKFVGEPSSEQKLKREEIANLYQNAKALLFPIHWEEPFGLVMTESMACGTPVLAYKRGSVPEIVVDSLTGYTIDPIGGVDGLTEAMKKINSLSTNEYQKISDNCRMRIEEEFSAEKMVENYEKLYRKLIGER